LIGVTVELLDYVLFMAWLYAQFSLQVLPWMTVRVPSLALALFVSFVLYCYKYVMFYLVD